jgi:hypothetical protein
MKIKAYRKKDNKAVELETIYIEGTAPELRRLAKFFDHCSNALTDSTENFGHAHLQDFERNEYPRKPDIVIAERL